MNPKYIFCSTTHFSGSKVLSFAFGFSKDFLSVRLGNPTNNRLAISLYDRGKFEEIREIFEKEKIMEIEKSLFNLEKKRYFESDPDFIRTFTKAACEFLKGNIAIVHLINNPVYVSLNMLEKYSDLLESLIFNSKSRMNIIKPDFLKYREYQHKFFRIFWYCLETYARSKDLISRQRDIKHYIFFTKWLLIPFEIRSLLKSLEVRIEDDKIESIKEAFKAEEDLFYSTKFSLSLDEARKMALRFVDKFGDQFMLSKEECLQLLEL